MPTARDDAAAQLARDLKVSKAVPARRSVRQMARTPKVVTTAEAKGGRGSAVHKLMTAIEAHGPINSHDLAKRTGVAGDRVSKLLSYNLVKGAIVNRKVKPDGQTRPCAEYATPAQAASHGWPPAGTKAGKSETKARKTGTKLQKTVTPPRAAVPGKLQRKTAKSQLHAAKPHAHGLLPEVSAAAYSPGDKPLEVPPFRCGVMSDGALVLDGNFGISDTGIILSGAETRVLVDYLRRLEMLGGTA